MATQDDPRPFTIAVDQSEIDDLRTRLRQTRWPDQEPVADWTQGTPLNYLQELCRYWAEVYDWRATEKRLNTIEQLMITIDGVDIHLLHLRSPNPDALPLVMTHGWPGSIIEFEGVTGPLSDPAANGGESVDAFHLVLPSLPGYGFSGKPTSTGWGVEKVAKTWAEMMSRLGYSRYGAQGGDWGAAVTTALGSVDPQHCVGIHLNMAIGRQPPPGADEREPTPDEQRTAKALAYYRQWDSGYSKIQQTRPQSVGYGLSDSPAGQAGWIVEKYQAWTDCDGHPENALSRDSMLDNIMMYWLNRAAASSARLYWESFGRFRPEPVEIPTGMADFPAEILPTPRSWAEQTYLDIRQWTTMPRGGHFAAWEQPSLFVDDVRSFFGPLR